MKLLKIITLSLILAFPSTHFAQAPNLGSSAGYVLFTSIGAIGNTGTSHLTGNVGTNNGSITGFGNVNGIMNNANGASALCATDVLAAYNQLNATIPTFFPAPLLGNGQSLNAGVYSISGNSTLNGSLTLNGQGNPSAVFIIKIQGSFASASNAQVVLTNSAQACNVFWKVEGMVSLSAGSTLRGTIIANNAAISINTGAKLEGRALSTSGSITIDGVLAYTPVGCGSLLLTGPNSPTLNSTACYAIFSSSGPVTNSGITFVYGTGDVGTNVGLTTGYNALNIGGAIHPIPDGSTGACSSDLLTLYTYLNSLTYDIELLYPAQFGHQLVLTPHVYRLNGATTFFDTLFLDGMGNANAVFVLQTNGALATGPYAVVKLRNGTQAQNVFWKIDGALNVNNNSEMVGTMIVNNGAVNFASGASLLGRVLTTSGAVTTAANNVTVTPGCSATNVPAITIQPLSTSACIGGSLNFQVTATGTGLTYQWRRGTLNISNGGNIIGANTPTLSISPATAGDVATNYNVVITSIGSGSVVSNSVSLTIDASPSILSQPANQTSCDGSAVTFSVNASGQTLTYVWRRGIVNLVNGANISGVNTAVLSINPVSQVDVSSNYNVIVSGKCSPMVISTDADLNLCLPTGLQSALKNGTYLIYPNPFQNSLTLDVSASITFETYTFVLYNVLGVDVLHRSIFTHHTLFQNLDLPSGIYHYKLLDHQNIVKSGRLISQ